MAIIASRRKKIRRFDLLIFIVSKKSLDIFVESLLLSFKFFFRSIHPKVFCEKYFPKNFVKFTGKHLCQSLFFIPVNLAKFFRIPFLQNISGWLLLSVALVLTVLLIAHPIIPVAAPQTVNVMEAIPKPNRIQFKL